MGWIVTVLWNHGPSMWRQIRRKSRPYPQLNAQEMADILAFLYQASNVEHPGNASASQCVFNEKGCVRCRGVDGTGSRTAPDLSGIATAGDATTWTRAMLNHAGSMVGPITSTLGQWPQFSGNEMNDLIAYVSHNSPQPATNTDQLSGHAKHGWSVFQGRCMRCHAVRGQGGTLGPGLGPERDLPLTTAQFAKRYVEPCSCDAATGT